MSNTCSISKNECANCGYSFEKICDLLMEVHRPKLLMPHPSSTVLKERTMIVTETYSTNDGNGRVPIRTSMTGQTEKTAYITEQCYNYLCRNCLHPIDDEGSCIKEGIA